jgi:hypothetical protein
LFTVATHPSELLVMGREALLTARGLRRHFRATGTPAQGEHKKGEHKNKASLRFANMSHALATEKHGLPAPYPRIPGVHFTRALG